METITIKLKKGIKDGKEAVLYKRDRKELGWTIQNRFGKWVNIKNTNGYHIGVSESDSMERALWVMQEYLENCLNPFGNRNVEFVNCTGE